MKAPENNTKIATGIFDKNADDYRAKFMDFDLYNDTFDLFCNSIAVQQASILDIACGPGNITRYILRVRPDFRVLGIDLAPAMLRIAAEYNPTANFELMDARDIRNTGNRYDGIMCGFCLPYLSEEEAVNLIHDSAALLNEDGVLYLSTMEEDDNNKSGIRHSSQGDELFMHYHRAAYLLEAIKESGLQLISMQRKAFTLEQAAPATDLIIICRKATTV